MSSQTQEFSTCMERIKTQISTLNQSRKFNQTFSVLTEATTAIRISNSQTKYQMHHGAAFQAMLEPRDQVLEHTFLFELDFSKKNFQDEEVSFTESKLFLEILQKVKLFLVEAVSNVVSISFKFLCKGDLEGREAKQYASKNILLNVHSIYRQVIKAIRQNEATKDLVDMDELMKTMIIETDNILNNILINLADSYPQAPASGGTPRMRQIITEASRVDDVENDFIFTSGIKISDYLTITQEKDKNGNEFDTAKLNQNGDYTEFIMRVINSAINVTHMNKEGTGDLTVFELFSQFNAHMFWSVQQKTFQKTLNSIYDQAEDAGQKHQAKIKTDVICSLYDTIFQSKAKKTFKFKKLQGITKEINQTWQSAAEGIQKMKLNKQFTLGHKIPSSVKPFDRQELASKQFTAKHSSILRILTKWAGYLEEIFEQSERLIKERVYPFTDINNQLCNLKAGDSDGDYKLNKQLEEEYKEVRKKFYSILKNSYGFIGKLLSNQHQSFVSNVNRYTQTRATSSKINAVLTSLMLNYTNLLIHHLLKAGQCISTDRGYRDINLVVFRVMDLMRSKYQCTQSSFINILKTMYMFDSKEQMHSKFKLIRIKNKLDQPANNVMINYLFMGKVQCQLQLSIQESKGKEKNYYTFSHFVYQLTRGKFGSIAECAIMISQLDPMIAACKSNYYQQKQELISLAKDRSVMNDKKDDLKDSIKLSNTQKQSSAIQSAFFECTVCNQLITNQNISRILEKPQMKICYQCIIKSYNSESYFKKQLKDNLQPVTKHRIRSYRALRSLRDQKYIVSFNSAGQFTLNVVLPLPKETKMFTIKVDSKLLESMESQEMDFSLLDYVDITHYLKRTLKQSQQPIPLTYYFNSPSSIPDGVLSVLNISKQLLRERVPQLVRDFKEFRQEKTIIKNIKYKAEIIKAHQQEGKMLDTVCKVLVLGQNKVEEGYTLKYRKEKRLDLSNVNKITSQRVGLSCIPRWVLECHNIKILDLDENNIQVVHKDELPQSIIQLSLKNNNLESIDISGLANLVNLFVKNNKITNIQIGNNSELKELSIKHNLIQKIGYLPPSLQKLWADKKAIASYDFKDLVKLKLLRVWNGKLERQELTNLPEEVKLKSM